VYRVASLPPTGQSLPSPRAIYTLQDEIRHCLTPLLILPQHLAPPAFPISNPRTVHQMRGILRRPSVTHAPLLLTLPYFPEPLPLRSFVRDHIYQPFHCSRGPMQVRRCLRVYWELLLYTRRRGHPSCLLPPPLPHRHTCHFVCFFVSGPVPAPLRSTYMLIPLSSRTAPPPRTTFRPSSLTLSSSFSHLPPTGTYAGGLHFVASNHHIRSLHPPSSLSLSSIAPVGPCASLYMLGLVSPVWISVGGGELPHAV